MLGDADNAVAWLREARVVRAPGVGRRVAAGGWRSILEALRRDSRYRDWLAEGTSPRTNRRVRPPLGKRASGDASRAA
jgi:hypothetical protein